MPWLRAPGCLLPFLGPLGILPLPSPSPPPKALLGRRRRSAKNPCDRSRKAPGGVGFLLAIPPLGLSPFDEHNILYHIKDKLRSSLYYIYRFLISYFVRPPHNFLATATPQREAQYKMQVSRVSATQRPFTAARPAVARSLRLTVVAVKPTKVCMCLINSQRSIEGLGARRLIFSLMAT